MSFFRIACSSFLFLCCSFTYADDTERAPRSPAFQRQASPWYLETGMRYWLGNSKFKWNLYNTNGDTLYSRITFQGVTTNTAETFFRLKHQNGLFFKGYLGGGSNTGGDFIDEDFPPVLNVYSKTKNEQDHGRLNYFSLDFGYDVLQYGSYKLSPFIGYHYWLTRYNGFGCKQAAGNANVCSTIAFPNTSDILNDNAIWHALRLGLNGEVQLLENLNFVVDVAYIYAYLLGDDYHNLRPDFRGEFFEGTGNGVQLDTTVNWFIKPNLSMGIGARYWEVKTKGYSHFEELSVSGRPQAIDVKQKNYGLILQSQYRFDDSQRSMLIIQKDGVDSALKKWEGFYLGANIGYGMNPNNVSIIPFQSTPAGIAYYSPLLVHLQSSGFLGGGQLGYNWTYNRLLFGMETDLDYASVDGTNSITFIPVNYLINHSVTQELNWFGTVRAKLGKIVSNTMLPYVTGGFSFANSTLLYAPTAFFTPSSTTIIKSTTSIQQIKLNWIAGAGLEYAVSDHLRYKLEYLYLNVGDIKLNTTYYAVGSAFRSNILRLGINYRV
ncbi:MAG: outer membrane beta-barrel protein [Legionella sp.]|nr:outer membrane beta-barrel protein [Legionella sp.]